MWLSYWFLNFLGKFPFVPWKNTSENILSTFSLALSHPLGSLYCLFNWSGNCTTLSDKMKTWPHPAFRNTYSLFQIAMCNYLINPDYPWCSIKEWLRLFSRCMYRRFSRRLLYRSCIPPCGTPDMRTFASEKELPILTFWVLFFKNDLNHLQDNSLNP